MKCVVSSIQKNPEACGHHVRLRSHSPLQLAQVWAGRNPQGSAGV